MPDKKILKAANEGNVYAMLSIAYIYHHGVDGDPDPQKAIEWYKRSATLGCGRAKWELAKMYRDGILVEHNDYEFVHWLTSAADANIPEAMISVAMRYFLGRLVPKDLYMASTWLEKVASMNNPLGEFYVGYAYKHGLTAEKDLKVAEMYWGRVKEHGDADLFYELGKRLEFGLRGMEVDLEDALYWYNLAAEMGSDKAFLASVSVSATLGGAKQDSYKAREMKIRMLPSSQEARQRDEFMAQADNCMYEGEFDLAVENYQQAAYMGNAEAMYMLAILYNGGEVVRRSDHVAYQYLQRAATAGCADALILLGQSYETGDGMPKDLQKALECYAKGVAQGNLTGYFYLSKYMEHPERFVNETQKVVR